MKRWAQLYLLAVLLCLVAASASAQSSGFATGIAWTYTPAGAFPAGGAIVTVCTSAATGAPCSPTATVYSDSALSMTVANPLAQCTVAGQIGCIDNLGNFSFYASAGAYSYTITTSIGNLNSYGPVPIIAVNTSAGGVGTIMGTIAAGQLPIGISANAVGGSSNIAVAASGYGFQFGSSVNYFDFGCNSTVGNLCIHANNGAIRFQSLASGSSESDFTFTGGSSPAVDFFGGIGGPGTGYLYFDGATSGACQHMVGPGSGGIYPIWSMCNKSTGTSTYTWYTPTTNPAPGQGIIASSVNSVSGNLQLGWSFPSFANMLPGSNSNAGSFTFVGNSIDLRLAAGTWAFKTDTTANIPATCIVGQEFFATDATAGQNPYYCTSTNTWTQQLNSGSGGASQALGNLAAVAINTTLLPASVNSVALGSGSLPFTNVFLGTVANQAASFTNVASLTANRQMYVPDANSTLVVPKTATTDEFVTAISAVGVVSQAHIAASSTGPYAYAADSGTATAYVVTLSPAITVYGTGVQVCFLPSHANSGTTPTLNVNAVGATTITKLGQTALVASDLVTTAVACVIYDGTYWELQNPNTVGFGVTSSSTNTFTNKTYNAESTGNVFSEPIRATFNAAGCSTGTSPGPAFDTGASNAPTPQCVGSNAIKAVLYYTRGNVAYINWHLPKDWNSSASTDLEIGLTSTDTNATDVISFDVQTACNANTGAVTDDPTLNAAQALSFTIGGSQVSGGALTATKTGLTMTGCSADYDFEIIITRDNSGTDTATNAGSAAAVKFAEVVTGVTKTAANR